MKGDFTRDSFEPLRHYTRVAMQQGRVQLDADWNEQASITQHYLRTLARDLIGPCGGPVDNCGFAVITDPKGLDSLTDAYGRPLGRARLEEIRERLASGDFLIGAGRYYVEGLLCENEAPLAYTEQPGYPFDDGTALENLRGPGQLLMYLDVWERHVSAAEDPDIVEVALGGPDTATRVQLVWQVKVIRADEPQECGNISALRRISLPSVRAKAELSHDIADSRVIGPHARYRGVENRLYRVEIHRGGHARAAGAGPSGATFKWSRENGSVVFQILDVSPDIPAGQTTVKVATLGHDQRSGLTVGDVVELVDDAYALRESAEPLHIVDSINRDRLEVVLSGVGSGSTGQDSRLHPLLRRWDHGGEVPAKDNTGGAVLINEATGIDDGWIGLEEGVAVQFAAPSVDAQPNEYRSGDYWLIPARTAIGDVVWPQHQEGDRLEPEMRPPRGVQHHYAALALATVGRDGAVVVDSPDCRSMFYTMPRTNGA
ncbi:MAG TPA: DUF6519 domain-containing protein [Jiangellaceae bacterium]